MKTEGLYLNYAKMINMCEGTKVKPWQGVRQPRTKELHRTDRHPDFTMHPDDYEFAVAILEDKPVFVGDVVFNKDTGIKYTVSELSAECMMKNYSWNPPKSTFTLNGVELPCPDGNKCGYQLSLLCGRHYFSNFHDAQKVANAINKLLQDATK